MGEIAIVPFDPRVHLTDSFRQTMGALSPTNAPDSVIMESHYFRCLNTTYTWVAVHGQDVVGSISVLFEWKLTRECQPVAHIEDVAVRPDWQSKGVGTLLVRRAQEFAREQGVRSIVLACDASRVGFYERLGFSVHGVAMRQLVAK